MGWFLGPLFLVYWGTGFTFLSRSVICWWASRLVFPWLEQIGQLQRRILKVAVACWLSLLSIWPGMVQLDCAIVLLLVSWGSILISTVAAPITRPPALNRAGSSFLACLAISILIYFLEVASLDGVVQNLRTVLICIAQMARETEHFFKYLLTICVFVRTIYYSVHWPTCWLEDFSSYEEGIIKGNGVRGKDSWGGRAKMYDIYARIYHN